MSCLLYYHDLERRRAGIPKRRRSHERRRRRHHLYLVFDDWTHGYSVRKVSPSRRQPAVRRKRLPRPFVRLEAVRGSPECFASAFGTMILSMYPLETELDPRDTTHWPSTRTFIPSLDVRLRAIIFGPGPANPVRPVYLAVGDDKLFILGVGTFQMISVDRSGGIDGGMDIDWWWRVLKKPPFEICNATSTSYALHPDGRSFLVSTKKEGSAATFAYDAEELSWKQLGNWALPFAGRSHFDALLNAFVGLSEDGQLYSWHVPGSDDTPPAVSKLSKEKLFSEDPAERHVGATLVYMGRRSKFCLVECVCIDQELKEGGDVGCFLYRLTSFTLSHDMNGDLTTGKSRRVEYYEVPGETTSRCSVVQWHFGCKVLKFAHSTMIQ